MPYSTPKTPKSTENWTWKQKVQLVYAAKFTHENYVNNRHEANKRISTSKFLKIFVVNIYMHLYSKFHSESFDYRENLVVFNLWLLEKDK